MEINGKNESNKIRKITSKKFQMSTPIIIAIMKNAKNN